MIFRCTLVLLCTCVLIACTHTPQKDTPSNPDNPSIPANAGNGEKIAALAKSLLGSPYKYGGASPKGFDCSGLVFYTHGKLGIATPRSSLQQYKSAKQINMNKLSSGDLVFFKLNRKPVSHVGIYIGNGRFVHAPQRGKSVAINQLNEQYWRPRIVGAGRLY